MERDASVFRITGSENLHATEHLSEMEALAARIEYRAVPVLEEGFQFPSRIVLGAPMGIERAHLFWRTASQQAAKAPSLGIAYQLEPLDGFPIGGVSRLAPLIEDSNSQPATIAGQDSIVVEASRSPEDGAFRTVVKRARGEAPYFRIDLMTQPGATVFDTERETAIWQTVVQGARAMPGTFQ